MSKKSYEEKKGDWMKIFGNEDLKFDLILPLRDTCSICNKNKATYLWIRKTGWFIKKDQYTLLCPECIKIVDKLKWYFETWNRLIAIDWLFSKTDIRKITDQAKQHLSLSEEVRTGKGSDKEDMKIVYPNGITIELSIEEFLKGKEIQRQLLRLEEEIISKPMIIESVENIKPINSKFKSKVFPQSSRKLSLDQIKEIKALAQQGMTDKQIALRMKLKSSSLVHYWRMNTPKELIWNEWRNKEESIGNPI